MGDLGAPPAAGGHRGFRGEVFICRRLGSLGAEPPALGDFCHIQLLELKLSKYAAMKNQF